MDRAALAARIQEILKSRPKGAGPAAGGPVTGPVTGPAQGFSPACTDGDESAAFAARCAAAEASARVLEVLGATLLEGAAGPCILVDRHYPLTHAHGRHPVGRYHEAAQRSRAALASFLDRDLPGHPLPCGPETRPPLLFFDLETTGLSGGAGTYAFLVGFGWFDDEGFQTRQFFLRGYGEERSLLHAVVRQLRGRHEGGAADGEQETCPVLVTYNGRAFDVPLIETRYLIHRLPSPFAALPHVDMLFPARRLWKRRHEQLGRRDACPTGERRPPAGMGRVQLPGGAGVPPADSSCSLTALERDILGLHRQDDVPGWEIPARYFGYARTGNAIGLEAVLEHNRLDLLSLGAVSATVLEMVATGAGAARERRDRLALGRLFEYLGRTDDAELCYAGAAAPDGTLEAGWDRHVRADALHWLALHRRRRRRFQEAAEAWRQLADIPGIDPERRREALEALAIHHEHRAIDLEAAQRFALSALQLADDARRVDEVRHRLGRLSRKIGQGSGGERPSSPAAQVRLPGS